MSARVIRDHLNAQHRAFFALLPFAVLGSVDGEGRPWATLREGAPGFLHARDPFHLRVEAPGDPDDPAEAGLGDGAGVGLLGIELATRRRNRLNGRIERSGSEGFAVRVEQSFGNCPQYIRIRHEVGPDRPHESRPRPRVSDRLDAAARAVIAAAETFFVASAVDAA
jgi:uncharacterized protein